MHDDLTITWLPRHPRHLVRVFADDARTLPPWPELLGPQASAPTSTSTCADAAALQRRNRHALRGQHGVALALGPDEWLMLPHADPVSAVCSDPGVAVIDASSAQWVVRLAGTPALGLLMSGCGIDLRSTGFLIDDFAQTRLGPFAVLLHRVGEAIYDLHVESSLREAIGTWLGHNAAILEATGTPP
jgi:heterotetrameric sarcosine oxidase gamma subunit